MKACSRCGTIAERDAGAARRAEQPPAQEVLPAGWSIETNERGIQWICADCTRANVRSIEAKLPEEWWE